MEERKPLSIAGRTISSQHRPYIIAELSANHNGSLDRAIRSVEVAQQCGVDAIKLQTFTPESMTLDCDRADFRIEGGLWDGYRLYDLYKVAAMPLDWHAQLFSYAALKGITIFSTPFDENAVDFLEELGAPAYKIASFELVDLPLLKHVAATGQPVLLSTGLATDLEIAEAVATIRGAGCESIVLLHCTSSYPATFEQANLPRIPYLKNMFNIEVGLSDHTLGVTAPVAAVALGARVIEKHFTLSREEGGLDSEFSLEPDELSLLCKSIKEAWTAIDDKGVDRTPQELANRKFRRSVYFVRDLQAGDRITPMDVRRIRPGFGLHPKHEQDLIGRRLKQKVVRGTPASFDLLDD